MAAAVADAEIVGIDAAATMLRYAQKHRLRSPHADRISYQLVDAKDLPFEDHVFDCVFSNTVLHHIAKPWIFLAEIRRVLKAKSCLLVRDLYRPKTATRARELVAEHAADAAPDQQELFRASLHAALTPQELATMAKRAGFRNFDIVIDSDRHMSLQIAALKK